MKRITLTICAAAFLFAACNNESKTETTTNDSGGKTASAVSPGTETEEPYVAPDSATMMKLWMENATPGDMHKLLSSSDGTWEGEGSSWQNEGGPAMPSKATATYKTTLNGLFQECVYKGDSYPGMPPFEGRGMTGYDNVKKKFVGTWCDNMGSAIMVMEGDYDPATKTFSLTGKASNPITGKDCTMRETIKVVDDNNQVMTIYGPDSKTNKEYKVMEIALKRKK